MSITVRAALPEDIPAIIDLMWAQVEYHGFAKQATFTAEALHNGLFGEPRYTEMLVGVVDETVVAYAAYYFGFRTTMGQPVMYLEDMHVGEDHRRQGVGRAIFAALAQEAKAHNCGVIEWGVLDWNRDAIRFYRRLGAVMYPPFRLFQLPAEAIDDLALGK